MKDGSRNMERTLNEERDMEKKSNQCLETRTYE